MKIVFERTLAAERQAALRRAVQTVLDSHPLFAGDVSQPENLTVGITVGMDKRTAVDHSAYPSDGYIRLDIDEHFYPLDSDMAEPLFVGDSDFHPKFFNLLTHEFSHFIDARLTPWFGYSDDKRPSDRDVLSIHLNLWDSFIDGRLGRKAPHGLGERQAEAESVNRVPRGLVERAWRGELNTYDAIVTAAVACRADIRGRPAS